MTDFKVGQTIWLQDFFNHGKNGIALGLQKDEIKEFYRGMHGESFKTADGYARPIYDGFKTKNEAIDAMIKHLESLRERND